MVSLSMAGCDGGPQQIAGPLRSEAKTYFAGFGRGTISRDREEKTLASSTSVRRENSSLRHGNSTVKLSRLKTTPPFSASRKPFFAPDRPRIKDLGLASGVALASNRLATQENSSYKAKSTSRAGHRKMVDLLKHIGI